MAWIRTVPNNSTLNFPKGGCFRIDRTVLVANRTGLTFEGNGATFDGQFHTEGGSPHWRIYLSKNITVRDMTVRGANPRAGVHEDAFDSSRQWEAAWEISGSRGILLDSVRAYDVFGDFVTIEPEWVRPNSITSRSVTVQNSHFERNGRQGIAITGAEGVAIRNNYIGEVRMALLDLEPQWPTLPIANVKFTGNKTGAVRLLWLANGGRCNAGVSNILVANNVMEGNSGGIKSNTPPRCASRGPFTIEKNTLIVRQSPSAAIWFSGSRDLLVRGNRVRFVHDYRTRTLVNIMKSTRTSVVENSAIVDPRDSLVWVTADRHSDYVQVRNVRL